MFGSNNFFKAIQKGDLEKLKKIIDKNPSLLEQAHSWKKDSGNFKGSLLDVAAFYNQPAIIEYLVKDKGMDIEKTDNSQNWTPLHHAARNGAARAVKTLLELGANPKAKTAGRSSPWDLAPSRSEAENLLQPYHDEEVRERAEKDKAVRIEGTWTSGSPDEIVYEHELPNGKYNLTRIFNFAAETLTTFTENLKTGNISPPETRAFDEIRGKREIIEDARARLAAFNGTSAKEIVPEQAAPQAAPARRQRGDYRDLASI